MNGTCDRDYHAAIPMQRVAQCGQLTKEALLS